MNPAYRLVASRARYRCEYCHAPQDAVNFAFDVEHIHPTMAGGTDNMALACRSCNVFKAARQRMQDPQTGEIISLYHPRKDIWDDHFEVSVIGMEIVGKTPTGRATIAALQMNSPLQQFARSQWKRLDLFP